MKFDKEISHYFSEWQKSENVHSDISVNDFNLINKQLCKVCTFPALTRVAGKVDLINEEYLNLDDEDKQNYFPLISGTVDNNQISGYIHKERLGDNSASEENVISWTRINGKKFFIQRKPVVTNDDSFVMKPQEESSVKYIWFALTSRMMSSEFGWTNKAGKETIRKIDISWVDRSEIREAIVKFIEYYNVKFDQYRQRISQLKSQVESFDKAFLPALFSAEKDQFIMEYFDQWAEKKNYLIKFEEISFEVGRILSSQPTDIQVCSKRMGFTPETVVDGNVNWYTVGDLSNVNSLFITEPKTKDKTTIELIKKKVDARGTGRSEKLKPIQKGDVLVSFKLTVGVSKIYDSEEVAYCNEAIDILTPNKGFLADYLAYNCMLEYPRRGSKTNNGLTLNDDSKKEVGILLPKKLEAYSSFELQQLIVEFIEEWREWRDEMFRRIHKLSQSIDQAEEVLIAKTFKGCDE